MKAVICRAYLRLFVLAVVWLSGRQTAVIQSVKGLLDYVKNAISVGMKAVTCRGYLRLFVLAVVWLSGRQTAVIQSVKGLLDGMLKMQFQLV